MSNRSRAAMLAAALSCAGIAVSAPSFAADLPTAGAGSASAMLAAVTAPLLAVDVRTLKAETNDFSSGDAIDPAGDAVTASAQGATLEQLVDANGDGEPANEDTRCLASSVYYESKGEPLSGQLAVAQTIINRAESGRFADSVCGVVRQPGQFSFLRDGAIPTPPKSTGAWARAVAIARIARDGLWKQVAPAALYFHARRVSPGWGKVRVASLGNHVFFR